jgi:hypothetical protein
LKTVPYNTNLAAEFWVLSALYRIGVEAHLTLGNKKAIDIVIIKDSEIVYTVDVKGVVGPYDWPADNINELEKPHHIYVFVCFENNIADPASNPSVWIIPSIDLKDFIIKYSTRTVVARSLVKKNGVEYKDGWHLFNKDIFSE